MLSSNNSLPHTHPPCVRVLAPATPQSRCQKHGWEKKKRGIAKLSNTLHHLARLGSFISKWKSGDWGYKSNLMAMAHMHPSIPIKIPIFWRGLKIVYPQAPKPIALPSFYLYNLYNGPVYGCPHVQAHCMFHYILRPIESLLLEGKYPFIQARGGALQFQLIALSL